jgi:hypothetical protein
METNIIRFTWECAPNEEKVFELQASYDESFTIDWGDGQSHDYVGEDGKMKLEYSYSKGGLFTVTVAAKEQDCLFTELRIDFHDIIVLVVSKCAALTKLVCSSNRLTALDVSHNAELMELDCYGNKLTLLELKTNTELETLDCCNNQLTALNLRYNMKLTGLKCRGNRLADLDLRNNVDLYLAWGDCGIGVSVIR